MIEIWNNFLYLGSMEIFCHLELFIVSREQEIILYFNF